MSNLSFNARQGLSVGTTPTPIVDSTGNITAPTIITTGNVTIGGNLTVTGPLLGNASTASNLSGTPALPNGTTATTQITADNTTKLATTAFVQAVVSSGTSNVTSFNTRVGNITLTSGDVTGALTYTPLNKTGDSMSGNLAMNTNNIIGLPALPFDSTAAASKAYVDNLVTSGTIWVAPIQSPDLCGIVTTVPGSPIASGAYIAYGGSYPQTWGGITDVAQYDVLHLSFGTWYRILTAAQFNSTTVTRMGSGIFTSGIDATLAGPDILQNDLIAYVGGVGANPLLPASWNFPHGRVGGKTFPVISANASTKTFTLTGNVTSSFHTNNSFTYAGGSASNGTYTIASVTFSTNTSVVVNETLSGGDSTGGTAEPEIKHGTTCLDNNPTDQHVGATEIYNFTNNAWLQIAGPGAVGDGVGLSYSGNVLNVNLGAGVIQLPSDEVGIDVYVGGGLMTTTDGGNVSVLTNAQLSLTNVGTAGTYTSVTTNSHGRVTAGSNPTPALATTSTNATITAVSTNATFYPTFVNATSGNLALDVNTGLTFNPNTNVLTTTIFSGNLTGTATTATSATTATAANGLTSATTIVSVSGATAPTVGQVLTATSNVVATWQTLSAASLSTNNVWLAQQTPMNGALTDGATIDWNGNTNGQVVRVTLGGNRTMNAPTNIQQYAMYMFRIQQDGTGSRTLAWNAAYKFGAGGAPTLTTTINGVDWLSFVGGAANTLEFVGVRLAAV